MVEWCMIPKHIDIYGERHKVKIVKGLDSAGLYEYKKKLISIKQDAPEQMLWSYLHECLHALWEVGRVNEVIPPEVEEIMNEQVCHFLLKHFTVKPK